ncbi:MAG: radical SAM protein [Halobacteria archaeon]
MGGFDSLPIWSDPETRGPLSWYFDVATNRMPAKHLITRRIPCETPLDAPEEDLWEEHRRATGRFLAVWERIRREELSLPGLATYSPSLLDLSAELARRMLAHCNFCRWNCRVDRSQGTKHGTCQLEADSRVSSFFHHRGEEAVFRGTRGSGTIFFTSCNMRCGFCQNGDISHDKENGMIATPEVLAAMARQLRLEGCHNINFVGGEPTIHLHAILEAVRLLGSGYRPDRGTLERALDFKVDGDMAGKPNGSDYHGDLNAPLLWNSNFFMSEPTMRLLRPLFDAWLPDFKFGNPECAMRLSRTPWYFETVAKNHKALFDWNEAVVVRHLVMPNHVECCTKPVLGWIAKQMPGVPVNVMDQFHPDHGCNPQDRRFNPKLADIARYPTAEELEEAFAYAESLKLNFAPLTFEKSLGQSRSVVHF